MINGDKMAFWEHDWEEFKDAFILGNFEESLKNVGQKANLKYAVQGAGLMGVNSILDWYANSPSLKGYVSNAWEYLPGDMNTGIEGFAREYLSMSGFQEHVLSAGTVSNDIALAGFTLAGVSLAALVAKRAYNHLNGKKGKDYKLALRDWIITPLKENKKSAALAVGGLLAGVGMMLYKPAAEVAGTVATGVAGAAANNSSAASSIYNTVSNISSNATPPIAPSITPNITTNMPSNISPVPSGTPNATSGVGNYTSMALASVYKSAGSIAGSLSGMGKKLSRINQELNYFLDNTYI
jgi:hypothetical protein